MSEHCRGCGKFVCGDADACLCGHETFAGELRRIKREEAWEREEARRWGTVIFVVLIVIAGLAVISGIQKHADAIRKYDTRSETQIRR